MKRAQRRWHRWIVLLLPAAMLLLAWVGWGEAPPPGNTHWPQALASAHTSDGH